MSVNESVSVCVNVELEEHMCMRECVRMHMGV
jgi:hypothetical protein